MAVESKKPAIHRDTLTPGVLVSRILAERSGLTLLETIVALAILTIGIAGVLHAFSTSMTATRSAESYSTAAMLANQVASELDRQDSLEPGVLSGTFEDAPGYSWEADVQSADEHGLMRTDIAVLWQQGKTVRHFDMVVCLREMGGVGNEAAPAGNPSRGGD